MSDDPFLRALRERPDDDETRLVYADWLEERGDPASASRARFIRLERALAALAEGDSRRAALSAQLRQLAERIEPGWLAAVSRPPIEKCRVTFDMKCPQRWDRLAPTAAASIRFCEACRRNVHYCATSEEALQHALCGNCIAVDARVLREKGDLDFLSLGMPKPPPRPAWDRPPPGVAAREHPSAEKPTWMRAGERVRVSEGTFAGMEGVVRSGVDAAGKVEVELTIFNRPTLVDLESYQIEPC
jgi:uncharacterized protein (TIGR02996 family)